MWIEENEVRTAIDKAGGVTRVANLCGVSGSCVYRWLHGKRVPNLEKARILAKEAEMSVEVLRPV
jgi:DNA-binding phage protein